MAALDTPWVGFASPTQDMPHEGSGASTSGDANISETTAAFSPSTIAGSSLASRRRSALIVRRKSPLLAATPPTVTRALAYSHPYIVFLTRLLGLLTWTTGDPWESYLVVAAFWFLVLHGDFIILCGGPLLLICGLIFMLYSRYSPPSSSKDEADAAASGRTLDEVVETLREFTTKCNILVEPLLDVMDFLATQQKATSASARPAMTVLLGRILYLTPVWFVFCLPPLYIITSRRIILTIGTIILTWHSKQARVSRVLLWRSVAIRHLCTLATGFDFTTLSDTSLSEVNHKPKPTEPPIAFAMRKNMREPSAVRFTFILYENQRRWLGLGWTTSLFSYERAPWTDEYLNPAPSKDEFELPEVKGEDAKWQWVPGSEWRVEIKNSAVRPRKDKGKSTVEGTDTEGWAYYDNKWHDFRGGEDGWTRYTRRRKWCRDAELVEVTSEERTADATDELKKPGATPPSTNNENKDGDSSEKGLASEAKHDDKGRSMDSTNAAQGGEESRNRRSSFSSAFSAAKSKVHDKHEKHVSDIKNLREKASQSKTNLLHGHGLSTKNENSAPNEHEPPPRHSVSSRADFEASKKKNGAKARKTHHPRPSKHNNRAEPLSTVKVNNWGQNADRNSSSSARSLRAREIATERDVPDRWGPHAGGPIAGPQRAQTQWGLSDDAEMGLS